MSLTVGQVLNNRYRIEALLGQGGMGAVYRALDFNLNLTVAVKENLDASPEAQKQFGREAGILARLSHPNLPRVTDHFFIPGQGQYLVMDFVEGEDLQTMLKRLGVLPEPQVLNWVLQICDALAYLHSQPSPIIHRDIKPGNIKIRPDGQAILVDFGIAKVYDPRLATTIGAKAVTPGYSPPEQYGGGTTDPRSDIYALGATLYHLLTGQMPPDSVQRVVVGNALPLPRQFNQRISPGIEQAILKAVEVTTDRRFQNVNDLRAALTQPGQGMPARSNWPPTSRPFPLVWLGLLGGLALVAVIVVVSMLAISSGAVHPVSTPTVASSIAQPQGPGGDTRPEFTPTATRPSTRTPTQSPVILTPEHTSTLSPAPLTFQTIPLGDIATASLSADYAVPPTGRQMLGGVPFDLNGRAFKSQAQPAPNNAYPTDAALDVGLAHVERVYVLITAGNAFQRGQGKTVGRVTLIFDAAPRLEVDLVLGSNLREWHAADNVVSSAPGVRQVWQGAVSGHPDLMGTLDMLTVEVPADRRNATLTRIEFFDTSASTVGSLDPALNVSGVTVAHR